MIDWPNQVWVADITYIPTGCGFLYLMAIMDRASRAVLSWRLSNTMDDSFCVEALEEALARFGKPQSFNTAQFTSVDFTGVLRKAEIRISMDGRGRWMDNVFFERLWRSLKYEDIYLKGYADGREARAGTPSRSPSTTDDVRIWRSPTARRWWCGVAASGERSTDRL